eukprot:GEMP01047522.1.p1 GENE.GEMP01047522.1~~GEMP01047522.1.p1  ORF type:complete len:290 (+),score=53.53 GEMP01047522.1:30-872(+)
MTLEQFFGVAPKQSIMGGYEVLEGTKWIQDSPNFPSNIRVTGCEPQALSIDLQPGQDFISESGTMLAKDAAIKHGVSIGNCFDALIRCCCAGEDIFRLKFQNETTKPGGIVLAPVYPSRVIPVDMEAIGGEITIKKSVFMASTDVKASFKLRFPSSIGTALVGGLGIILQSVRAKGWLFLNASGTILTKRLEHGEECICDGESLVAFSQQCLYSYRLAVPRSCGAGCATCCFAGEGGFNAVITGPGFVILQTCPFEKLAKELYPQQEGGGGADTGGGGGD